MLRLLVLTGALAVAGRPDNFRAALATRRPRRPIRRRRRLLQYEAASAHDYGFRWPLARCNLDKCGKLRFAVRGIAETNMICIDIVADEQALGAADEVDDDANSGHGCWLQ